MKIIRNEIQCKQCGDVIASNYRHEFVRCKCGACAVDGGLFYLRRCCTREDGYIERAIVTQEDGSGTETT